MELFNVDKEMCRKDGICIAACPIGCLTADAEGFPVETANNGCIKCGQCVAICPHGALTHNSLPMAARAARPPQAPLSLGLTLMRERMVQLGGTLLVESAPGQGTHIVAELEL